MPITIDRPRSRKDLIGRSVWLHHQRGKGYLDRVGAMDAELIITDVYEDIRVVRVAGDATSREHHIKNTAISLLRPADQLTYEADRRAKGAGR